MEKRKLSPKERNQLLAWRNFTQDENGAMPATIAAMKLRMTTSGLYQAGERGWIKFFSVGRDRWYGEKTVSIYLAKRESEKNFQTFRAEKPRDCSETGKDGHGDWSPVER